MTYNHIFSSFLPKIDSFSDFGFSPQGDGSYFMRKNLSQQNFYAEFVLNLKTSTLEVHLFDGDLKERYPLFDLPSSHGAFVSALREEVASIIEDFTRRCFITKEIRQPYFDFLQKEFSLLPEYPWDPKKQDKKTENPSSAKKSTFKTDAYADYAVFRCPNNKWFALIGHITYKNLGFTHEGADQKVWSVNLKADPQDIPALIDHKSIFPAFHMNKKHWITVVLTSVTDFEQLCRLTRNSFDLVMGKK